MFLKNQRWTQYQKCNSTFIIYVNKYLCKFMKNICCNKSCRVTKKKNFYLLQERVAEYWLQEGKVWKEVYRNYFFYIERSLHS